jgi:TrmH family RNA methyltransferase
VERITSRQNALVAQYRALARARADDLLLLDGPHLVGEALDAGITLRHAMAAADAAARPEIAHLLDRLQRTAVPVASGSATVMDAVSPVRSSSDIVAIGVRPRTLPAAGGAERGPWILLSDIQDPGNLGAIVRVAEAAGASGVLVAGQSADPFGWKALRGSMGSALRLPVSTVSEIDRSVADARRRGMRVLATVPRGGTSIFEADLTGPVALLIGGEGPGLPAAIVDAADARITIPMESPVESLNAAAAAAIALYEARRQRSHNAQSAPQPSELLTSDF